MAGRPESPLDPSQGPVQRLAFALRKLRDEAGRPTYREMARRTRLGATTLSSAGAGERLPTLPVLLAYVQACGGDPQEWERRWRQAVRENTAEPVADDADDPPYRGLGRFEPGDRELFFGRADEVARLAARVRTDRLVAVVGASGSGKSSLLRAGLIPVLQTAEVPGPQLGAIRICTPGPHPLTAHLNLMMPSRRDGDTVVVIDQFEELFTLCTDPAERSAFIDLLLTSGEPDSRLRVVLAVRADFLGRCAEHHRLTEALRETTLLLGPMGPAALREAIVKPATAAGLIVERTLTARIITEVAEEPGSLPLMSHALLETWHRRRGRALTEAMYDAAGGIHGAVAATAEQVYTSLSPPEAQTARRILLRLVTPGEGTQDTRRPTHRTELNTASTTAKTGHVLEQLVKARLLTLDGDTVDLAHEALITAWPRYKAWIDQDRERMRLHRRLTEAAHAWHDLDHDPGALYRGARLAMAEDAFSPEHHTELTRMESEFLTTSTTARDRDLRNAARAARLLRALITALSVLLVLGLAAGFIAWQQTHTSEDEQRFALSRRLAAQSTALIDTNPDLASLLAVEAYRTSPTTEATGSLYNAAALPLERRITGHAGAVSSLAFNSGGHTLAIAGMWPTGNSHVLTWNTLTGKSRIVMTGRIDNAAFGPGGRTVAIQNDRQEVELWSTVTKRAPIALAGDTRSVQSLVFSPDGHTLATSGSDHIVRLWNAATGALRTTLASRTTGGAALAFSPDSRTLATSQADGTVKLWNPATGRLRTTLRRPSEWTVTSLAFSPNKRTLAAGSNGTVQLYDLATGRMTRTLSGHTGSVLSLAFSPDSRTLATSSNDDTVQVWDTGTNRLRYTLVGHTEPILALAFSPDGHTLATGDDAGSVRLWDTTVGVPHATLSVPADPAADSFGSGSTGPFSAFAPSGRALATLSMAGTVRLWGDTTIGTQRTIVSGDGQNGRARDIALAFGPDGRAIVTVQENGTVTTWDTTTGNPRTTTGNPGYADPTPTLSPDGRTLAISDDKGQVTLRTVATGRSRTLRLNASGHEISRFSPDGDTLATLAWNKTGNGHAVQLWNTTTGSLRSTIDPGMPLALSFGGRTLATGGENTVQLWNTTTGQATATLHTGTATVTSAAFSPDGRTLATTSNDGIIRLWDTATGLLRTRMQANTRLLSSVIFSPDGHALATTANDGAAQLWRAILPNAAQAMAKICRSVDRNLTAQERSQYLGQQSEPAACPQVPGSVQ